MGLRPTKGHEDAAGGFLGINDWTTSLTESIGV